MNCIVTNNHIRYLSINMSETTKGRAYCCILCECVEGNKHRFENKVLMNRIHKCRIVDILTETQNIDMYERMRNQQIEANTNNMGNIDMVLILRTRENQQM